jgi:arsenate reductase (thioredoxin)
MAFRERTQKGRRARLAASMRIETRHRDEFASREAVMAIRVLFLSRFNSARSQIAEGFMRELGGADIDVRSAGSAAFGVDPRAVLVMAERAIDISGQRATELEESLGSAPFDYLITVCERDEKECPGFPSDGTREYWPLSDPARVEGSDGERMARFREVRDQIEARVRDWLESHRRELASGTTPSASRRPFAIPRAHRRDGPTEAVRQDRMREQDELVETGRKAAP